MGLAWRLITSLGLAPMLMSSAAAAPFESATVRRIIDGKEVYVDRQQATVNDTANRGQQISTGSSRTELLFDQRAIGFLGRNSLITLGQECFRLLSGKVLINGPQTSCLGSKVLGVRGTTYVLSSTEDGGYDLTVLSGTAAVGEASAIKNGISTEENFNILTKYPSLNPVVSLGSSAWGSNTGGTNLGQAFGLALGDLSFFTPIIQEKSSSLLYSYSTGSSNFDGSWGASSEVGYTWYDPNNQSSNNILIGYDGWNTQGCFHSQIAIGGKIERNHWQFSTNGGIATDNCEDSLSFATAKIGIPIVNLGEQSIHLTLGPYVMHGLDNQYGGGRIGVSLPYSNALEMNVYGQHDGLLDTVIGSQITYRFAPAGQFVRDPNLKTPRHKSLQPWRNKNIDKVQPVQITIGRRENIQSEIDPQSLESDIVTMIEAGEEASFNRNGELTRKGAISRERFAELVENNMKGHNPLPEGRAIAETYKRLYGSTNPSIQATAGVDWMISAQTPFRRLRADNNLVIPKDKLPKSSVSQQSVEEQVTYTYICKEVGGSFYYPEYSNINSATRFTTTDKSSASCTGKLAGTGGGNETQAQFL